MSAVVGSRAVLVLGTVVFARDVLIAGKHRARVLMAMIPDRHGCMETRCCRPFVVHGAVTHDTRHGLERGRGERNQEEEGDEASQAHGTGLEA